MERDDAVDGLPRTYRRVLELLAAGRTPAEIAEALGVEVEAGEPLVDLAQAKLARLTDASTSPVLVPEEDR